MGVYYSIKIKLLKKVYRLKINHIGLKFITMFLFDVSCRPGNRIGITQTLFLIFFRNLTNKLNSEKTPVFFQGNGK